MSLSEEKIANPLNFYHKPSEIAHDRHLTLEDKIKALDNWLNDIELRQIAEEENMIAVTREQKEEVAYLRRLLRTYRAHQQHTNQSAH